MCDCSLFVSRECACHTCRVDGHQSSRQIAKGSFLCCVNHNRRKQNAVFLLKCESLSCLPTTFENPRHITLHLRGKTPLLASLEVSSDLPHPALLTRTCPLSLQSNPIHLLRTNQPQNRPSSRSLKMTLPPQKTPKSEWLSLKHKASPRRLRFSSATLMKRIKARPRSQSRKPSRRQSIMNRLKSYRNKGRVRIDAPS